MKIANSNNFNVIKGANKAQTKVNAVKTYVKQDEFVKSSQNSQISFGSTRLMSAKDQASRLFNVLIKNIGDNNSRSRKIYNVLFESFGIHTEIFEKNKINSASLDKALDHLIGERGNLIKDSKIYGAHSFARALEAFYSKEHKIKDIKVDKGYLIINYSYFNDTVEKQRNCISLSTLANFRNDGSFFGVKKNIGFSDEHFEAMERAFKENKELSKQILKKFAKKGNQEAKAALGQIKNNSALSDDLAMEFLKNLDLSTENCEILLKYSNEFSRIQTGSAYNATKVLKINRDLNKMVNAEHLDCIKIQSWQDLGKKVKDVKSANEFGDSFLEVEFEDGSKETVSIFTKSLISQEDIDKFKNMCESSSVKSKIDKFYEKAQDEILCIDEGLIGQWELQHKKIMQVSTLNGFSEDFIEITFEDGTKQKVRLARQTKYGRIMPNGFEYFLSKMCVNENAKEFFNKRLNYEALSIDEFFRAFDDEKIGQIIDIQQDMQRNGIYEVFYSLKGKPGKILNKTVFLEGPLTDDDINKIIELKTKEKDKAFGYVLDSETEMLKKIATMFRAEKRVYVAQEMKDIAKEALENGFVMMTENGQKKIVGQSHGILFEAWFDEMENGEQAIRSFYPIASGEESHEKALDYLIKTEKLHYYPQIVYGSLPKMHKNKIMPEYKKIMNMRNGSKNDVSSAYLT